VKGESAVDVDRGETELLAADVLRDEAVAVDGHPPEIWVVIEVAKGDAAGEADRVVHHHWLPAVPRVPIGTKEGPPDRPREYGGSGSPRKSTR
jgi:hypothetical protein